MPGAFSFLPTVIPQTPDARYYDYSPTALAMPPNLAGLNGNMGNMGHQNGGGNGHGGHRGHNDSHAAASYAMNQFSREQLLQRPPFVIYLSLHIPNNHKLIQLISIFSNF